MSKSIKVEYRMSEFEVEHQGYALDIRVTSATDTTDHIFIFQVPPAAMADGQAVFQCVASPVQLEEIPEDTPDVENGMPYYRTDSVTLHFSHPDTLLMYRNMLSEDIAQLVRSLNVLDTLAEPQEVTYI